MAGIPTAFYQEFQDFTKYNREILEEIKSQVKKTNGRVNKHDTELALIKNNYENCPARDMKKLPNQISTRSNKIAFIALGIVLADTVFQLIVHYRKQKICFDSAMLAQGEALVHRQVVACTLLNM